MKPTSNWDAPSCERGLLLGLPRHDEPWDVMSDLVRMPKDCP